MPRESRSDSCSSTASSGSSGSSSSSSISSSCSEAGASASTLGVKRKRLDSEEVNSTAAAENGKAAAPPSTRRRVEEKGEVAAEEATVGRSANQADDDNRFKEDLLKLRTGGTYIPPHRMKKLSSKITDKTSKEYQRMTWATLRKGIHGVVNKANVANIKSILPELFEQNLVRGRGLFARALMKAQMASPGFTHVYAALIAVVNTKLPENGELLLKRLIIQFRKAFKRSDRRAAVSSIKFIAHLVNQQVAHEILALQVLTLLLEEKTLTDDSIHLACDFTKEVGFYLFEVCPRGMHAIFDRFRSILQEGNAAGPRVQYLIEDLFAIRKSEFKDYPSIVSDLDLVNSDDQITHELGLDDEDLDRESLLDVFRFNPAYEKSESLWKRVRAEILGDSDDDDDDDESDAGSSDSGTEADDENVSGDEEEDVEGSDGGARGIVESSQTAYVDGIKDVTEADLVNLRRTIYLTIMSSISFEECSHKILKLNVQEGLESEVVNMLVECCSQERTYLTYYGLIGQRFCDVDFKYQDAVHKVFAEKYETIHRLEINRLRNVAKFFAHLLATDALPWTAFECIHMNEDETTSSSRIFVKVLCQELATRLGIAKLRERFFVPDERMQYVFRNAFPRDTPRNTRFAINFYTSIGLGALTDELRVHLANAPKRVIAPRRDDSDSESSASSSGSSSSRSYSSSGSSSSGSDSSSSDTGSSYDSDSSSVSESSAAAKPPLSTAPAESLAAPKSDAARESFLDNLNKRAMNRRGGQRSAPPKETQPPTSKVKEEPRPAPRVLKRDVANEIDDFLANSAAAAEESRRNAPGVAVDSSDAAIKRKNFLDALNRKALARRGACDDAASQNNRSRATARRDSPRRSPRRHSPPRRYGQDSSRGGRSPPRRSPRLSRKRGAR